MQFQGQLKKRNCLSAGRQSDGLLQWKKASQNLQNFIQTEQLNFMKSFQSPRQKSSSVKKDKLSQIKSMAVIYFSNKETQRTPRQYSTQSRTTNKSLLLKPRYIKSPLLLPKSPKKQMQTFPMKSNPQVGIQAFDQEPLGKKRDMTEQNICLKQLVQILQSEVLSYSRIITQKENKINEMSAQIQKYTEKLKFQIQLTNEAKQKWEKEVQLNKCMEYIIAELNEKVSNLLNKNTLLQETVDEFKLREEQNLTDTFSGSHSSFSINSENQKKFQYSELFKNSDPIIQDLESRILMEDKESWSFSGLDISSFMKTPNKIHLVSTCPWEETRPTSANELIPDQQIDQIIVKHKMQINQLHEKLKYYEIQNQMLRRRKQMTQKNTIEIEELRFRIYKLSEQNKLMQTQNRKKPKSPEQKPEKYQQKPRSHLSSNKQADSSNIVLKKPKKIQQKVQVKAKQRVALEIKQNKVENTQKIENQEPLLSPKRKSSLQMKFMRRPSRSPRSSTSLDDDSEISLEFSPERV